MRTDSGDRRARLLLSAVAEPGDPDLPRLVRQHGAEAVLERVRSRSAAGKVQGWQTRLEGLDAGLLEDQGARAGARFVCPDDPDWPAGLDDLRSLESGVGQRRTGAPVGVWVKGDVRRHDAAVAVVGARQCSSYGDEVVARLSQGLCARGMSIVSGGAYGIDARAHAATLDVGGHTVAVMAGGIDKTYPAGNAALLDRVAAEGAVVSEAPPGAVPSRSRFLVRNRLIAALSAGTVVVEAALRSGSLNTLRWARQLGRGAMVVPGSVLAVTSGGTNQMLREPGVLAVTAADEILEHVSPVGQNLAERPSGPVTPRDGLSVVEQQVLDAFPAYEAIDLDALRRRSGCPAPGVAAAVATLLSEGLVEARGDSFRTTVAARA